jgi:hypothetical protein
MALRRTSPSRTRHGLAKKNELHNGGEKNELHNGGEKNDLNSDAFAGRVSIEDIEDIENNPWFAIDNGSK